MARKSARSIERLTAVLAPPSPTRPGPAFPGSEERGVGPPGVGWRSPDGPVFPSGEARLLEPPGVRWRPPDSTARTGSASAGSASAERWVFNHEPPLAVAPGEDPAVVPAGAVPAAG